MRILALISLAVIVLASQGQISVAQSPTPEKSATKEIGRVGTLSPDEARRAARARKRAASATKVAPAGPSGSPHVAHGAVPTMQPKTIAQQAPVPPSKADGPHLAQGNAPAAAVRPKRDRHLASAARRRTAARAETSRADARRSRRAFAYGPRSGAHVGDVVPRRVRLYPLPPDYPPAYAYGNAQPEPYPVYQPVYPPYPGGRYGGEDEDQR